MITTDPIADMLTRIRNAIAVNKNQVRVPFSKLKLTVATLLVEAGFLEAIETIEEGKFKEIKITINKTDSSPKINELARISKPGRRLYVKADKIPKVMDGRGIMIVSTSKGVMTDAEARSEGIGGELMCKVF
ncbi:TPA: 30S ribosomal protein S8 [Candidatus Saccharibacteria bacterium]|nr:30S ribosomal protein S8 [Candidatus Saccharibacteria bacterium]HIO87386.1 30S ribosomal protein S8 [Candidatus Saccharibacteria bacterium]